MESAAPLGEITQGCAGARNPPPPKSLTFQAFNWRGTCIVANVKQGMRVFEWAVVAALSVLIIAGLVRAGGQIREETPTDAHTSQR